MFVHRRAVRFEEVDAANIVFFARYFFMCHDALAAFFDAIPGGYASIVVGRGLGLPAVHAECDYAASLRFGDTARIEVTVSHVGVTSVGFDYRMVREHDDVEVGRVKQTSVLCELASMKKVELPADIRALLTLHRA